VKYDILRGDGAGWWVSRIGGLQGSAHTVPAFNLLAQSFPMAVSTADRQPGCVCSLHWEKLWGISKWNFY